MPDVEIAPISQSLYRDPLLEVTLSHLPDRSVGKLELHNIASGTKVNIALDAAALAVMLADPDAKPQGNAAAPVEVEKKFILETEVADFRDKLAAYESIELSQFYLALDKQSGMSVRVRDEGGEKKLTIKVGYGERRVEREIVIAENEYADCVGLFRELDRFAPIVKQRFYIPESGTDVEVDLFSLPIDSIYAEIEYNPTLAEQAQLAKNGADWLAEHLGGTWRDVSTDKAHTNANIALAGKSL